MKLWKSRSRPFPPFPWNAGSVSREFPAHPCPSQAPTFPRLGIFREFQPAIPGKTPLDPWAIPGQHPGITEAPVPTEFREIHPASQNPAGLVFFLGINPGNLGISAIPAAEIPAFPAFLQPDPTHPCQFPREFHGFPGFYREFRVHGRGINSGRIQPGLGFPGIPTEFLRFSHI